MSPGRKPSPMQDRIYEMHRNDCFLTKAEIARRLDCSDKYVAVVFSRLRLTVGFPPMSPEELTRKSLHPPGWREAIAKPIPFQPRKQANQSCKYLYYSKALNCTVECEAPTSGHTYCRACAHRLATSTSGRRYTDMFGSPHVRITA